MPTISSWLRGSTRAEREREALALKRREVEALERIAMTRSDLARLLRYHRRRYGREITRLIYEMIKAGHLNPEPYWRSFDDRPL